MNWGKDLAIEAISKLIKASTHGTHSTEAHTAYTVQKYSSVLESNSLISYQKVFPLLPWDTQNRQEKKPVYHTVHIAVSWPSSKLGLFMLCGQEVVWQTVKRIYRSRERKLSCREAHDVLKHCQDLLQLQAPALASPPLEHRGMHRQRQRWSPPTAAYSIAQAGPFCFCVLRLNCRHVPHMAKAIFKMTLL